MNLQHNALLHVTCLHMITTIYTYYQMYTTLTQIWVLRFLLVSSNSCTISLYDRSCWPYGKQSAGTVMDIRIVISIGTHVCIQHVQQKVCSFHSNIQLYITPTHLSHCMYINLIVKQQWDDCGMPCTTGQVKESPTLLWMCGMSNLYHAHITAYYSSTNNSHNKYH